ncbi:Unknown protein [Striga hermonthica]|uniref:Uncharacterized protein n=1 Tax=Striga hermonthica TaxID=68872 RepID=A0A9N7MZ57_STRHE|nr:Unknown protein [Striga hermonthica]
MADLPGLGDYVVQGVNVDLGVENDGFTVSGIDVDPLPVGVVPTNQQVAAEDRRRRKLVKMVPDMNELDAAERELRYHEVLNRANPMPPLPPALLLMLQNMQENIQNINLRMEALLRVSSARSRNQRIKEEEMNELYRPLPKLMAGHPYVAVLPVQGVNIAVGGYQVGDLPPDGLVPTNNEGYIEASHLNLPELRRKLRAIYWFYHDESLFIPQNAPLQMCRQGLVALKRFHLP